MKLFSLISLLTIILFFSCEDRDASRIKEAKTNEAKNDRIKTIYDSISKTGLKVSAYLIYDDGTLSNFDVLNDKTIALWNVIGGDGDAMKPSENTKISFAGNLDSLNIKIKNGQKTVLDTMIIHSDKNVDYIIKNTGCQEVYVNLLKKSNKTIYNDTIPFHCGE